MNVKDLNQYLKKSTMTDSEIHDLKEARRRRNNRVYVRANMRARSVCLVTLPLLEQGPGRSGRQLAAEC